MTPNTRAHCTPGDDAGFTASVEFDHLVSDLPAEQTLTLLRSASGYEPWLAQSLAGNVLIVFGMQQCQWWNAGEAAMKVWRDLELEWQPVGLEICRSDLWIEEQFFDHEPDGVENGRSRTEPDDLRKQATVAIEVEPESSSSRYPTDDDLTHVFHGGPRGRTSRSTAGRPQLVVEMPGSALEVAQSIIKPAFAISAGRSITRIRAVRSDLYRPIPSHLGHDLTDSDSDFESEPPPASSSPDQPRHPEWSYVTDDDGNRSVIMTDLRVRLADWSVKTTTVEGVTRTSGFTLGCGWLDELGGVNAVSDGQVVDAWEAPVDPDVRVEAFVVDGRLLPVDPWDELAATLTETLYAKPAGFVIDLNASIATPEGYDDEVWSAQLVALSGGAFMSRRSRIALLDPVLSRYPIVEGKLDRPRPDGVSGDCTDGYTLSRKRQLVARDGVYWFRSLAGMKTTDGISRSDRFVDPAHVSDAGSEPKSHGQDVEEGTWYPYWGYFNGPRVDRLVRASDPDDVTTAETYNHTHGWIRTDDAPDTLMRAKYLGDWDPISEDEAIRAIKIVHRPKAWRP